MEKNKKNYILYMKKIDKKNRINILKQKIKILKHNLNPNFITDEELLKKKEDYERRQMNIIRDERESLFKDVKNYDINYIQKIIDEFKDYSDYSEFNFDKILDSYKKGYISPEDLKKYIDREYNILLTKIYEKIMNGNIDQIKTNLYNFIVVKNRFFNYNINDLQKLKKEKKISNVEYDVYKNLYTIPSEKLFYYIIFSNLSSAEIDNINIDIIRNLAKDYIKKFLNFKFQRFLTGGSKRGKNNINEIIDNSPPILLPNNLITPTTTENNTPQFILPNTSIPVNQPIYTNYIPNVNYTTPYTNNYPQYYVQPNIPNMLNEAFLNNPNLNINNNNNNNNNNIPNNINDNLFGTVLNEDFDFFQNNEEDDEKELKKAYYDFKKGNEIEKKKLKKIPMKYFLKDIMSNISNTNNQNIQEIHKLLQMLQKTDKNNKTEVNRILLSIVKIASNLSQYNDINTSINMIQRYLSAIPSNNETNQNILTKIISFLGNSLYKFYHFITGNGNDINKLDGLNNFQIDKFAKKLNINNYIGTFLYDDFDKINNIVRNLNLNKYGFILNTLTNKDLLDDPNAIGHWIGIVIDHKKEQFLYYDSFGDPIKDKNFIEKIYGLKKDPNIPYKLKINRIQFQNINTNNCGYFAIQFLFDILNNKKDFKNATLFSELIKDDVNGENEIEKFKKFHNI